MSLSDKVLCGIGLILYHKIQENNLEDGKEKQSNKKNSNNKIEKKLGKGKDKKRLWMKDWLKKRTQLSPREKIANVSIATPILNEFQELFQIKPIIFEDLLSIIGPFIEKQNTLLREPIPTEQRLIIALRYLTTGSSFEDMKHASLVSPQAIGKIVMETCEAIQQVLNSCIEIPKTAADWKTIAKGFQQKCNFPHCLGVADGKHISIKRPSYSGALYINYKRLNSIILMGVVNSNYEFILVEAGVNGRISENGVLPHTEFGRAFYESSLNLPEPSPLPDKATSFSYVFAGKEVFHLEENFLTPYYGDHLSEEQQVFNSRLDRVTRVADNTFGILGSKFRILQKTINLQPDKARAVMLAVCYLHNYFRQKCPDEYMPIGSYDRECLESGTIEKGSWRQKPPLQELQPISSDTLSDTAQQIRDEFSLYFSNKDMLDIKTEE